jgi:hypothetical protein
MSCFEEKEILNSSSKQDRLCVLDTRALNYKTVHYGTSTPDT